MIKRSDRIRKIATLAQAEERQQCREMSDSQRQLNGQLQKLEELEAYRRTYLARPRPSGSVSTSHWQDYQSFLQRLDQAVNVQQQAVMQGRKNRDLHRRHWVVKRQRLESLERVVERYRRQEDIEKERRDQRAADDLTVRSDIYDT